MKLGSKQILAMILISLTLLQTTGCTLVGYGLGTYSDIHSERDYKPFDPESAGVIDSEQTRLTLSCGVTLDGYCYGKHDDKTIRFSTEKHNILSPQYIRLKEKNRKGWDIVLVPIGDIDTIAIVETNWTKRMVPAFMGFVLDCLSIAVYIMIIVTRDAPTN